MNNNKRKEFKKLGVAEREKGNLKQAEKMFLSIIKSDITNNSYEEDIFDQLIRTYSMQLNISKNIMQKRNLLRKIIRYFKITEDLQNKGLLLKALLPITQISIAEIKIDLAETFTKKKKFKELNSALLLINKAIPKLSETRLHKIDGLCIKAKILTNLEEYENALNSITLAEKLLYKRYLKIFENKKNNTNERKILEKKVTLIKIKNYIEEIFHMYAYVYNKSDRSLLAKFYSNAVLNSRDINIKNTYS